MGASHCPNANLKTIYFRGGEIRKMFHWAELRKKNRRFSGDRNLDPRLASAEINAERTPKPDLDAPVFCQVPNFCSIQSKIGRDATKDAFTICRREASKLHFFLEKRRKPR